MAYRDRPPSHPTSGPTPRWRIVLARLRLAAAEARMVRPMAALLVAAVVADQVSEHAAEAERREMARQRLDLALHRIHEQDEEMARRLEAMDRQIRLMETALRSCER